MIISPHKCDVRTYMHFVLIYSQQGMSGWAVLLSLYSSSRSRFKLIHNEDNFQDGTRCRVLHLESYLHCGRYDQSWWLGLAAGLRSRLGDRLGSAARIHTTTIPRDRDVSLRGT